jgi:hypothetical protein
VSVTIEWNGSKWAGQAPDPLAVLIDVLGREPLNPCFEEYGNFVMPCEFGSGLVHLHGNFYRVSHVFSIKGTVEELREVIVAIDANRRTQAYADAKRETAEHKAQAARRDRKVSR